MAGEWKSLLAEERAHLVDIERRPGIHEDARVLTRRFDKIPRKHIDAALDYLATYASVINGDVASVTVVDPKAGTETYTGTWHRLSIQSKLDAHENCSIIQVLAYGDPEEYEATYGVTCDTTGTKTYRWGMTREQLDTFVAEYTSNEVATTKNITVSQNTKGSFDAIADVAVKDTTGPQLTVEYTYASDSSHTVTVTRHWNLIKSDLDVFIGKHTIPVDGRSVNIQVNRNADCTYDLVITVTETSGGLDIDYTVGVNCDHLQSVSLRWGMTEAESTAFAASYSAKEVAVTKTVSVSKNADETFNVNAQSTRVDTEGAHLELEYTYPSDASHEVTVIRRWNMLKDVMQALIAEHSVKVDGRSVNIQVNRNADCTYDVIVTLTDTTGGLDIDYTVGVSCDHLQSVSLRWDLSEDAAQAFASAYSAKEVGVTKTVSMSRNADNTFNVNAQSTRADTEGLHLECEYTYPSDASHVVTVIRRWNMLKDVMQSLIAEHSERVSGRSVNIQVNRNADCTYDVVITLTDTEGGLDIDYTVGVNCDTLQSVSLRWDLSEEEAKAFASAYSAKEVGVTNTVRVTRNADNTFNVNAQSTTSQYREIESFEAYRDGQKIEDINEFLGVTTESPDLETDLAGKAVRVRRTIKPDCTIDYEKNIITPIDVEATDYSESHAESSSLLSHTTGPELPLPSAPPEGEVLVHEQEPTQFKGLFRTNARTRTAKNQTSTNYRRTHAQTSVGAEETQGDLLGDPGAPGEGTITVVEQSPTIFGKVKKLFRTVTAINQSRTTYRESHAESGVEDSETQAAGEGGVPSVSKGTVQDVIQGPTEFGLTNKRTITRSAKNQLSTNYRSTHAQTSVGNAETQGDAALDPGAPGEGTITVVEQSPTIFGKMRKLFRTVTAINQSRSTYRVSHAESSVEDSETQGDATATAPSADPGVVTAVIQAPTEFGKTGKRTITRSAKNQSAANYRDTHSESSSEVTETQGDSTVAPTAGRGTIKQVVQTPTEFGKVSKREMTRTAKDQSTGSFKSAETLNSYTTSTLYSNSTTEPTLGDLQFGSVTKRKNEFGLWDGEVRVTTYGSTFSSSGGGEAPWDHEPVITAMSSMGYKVKVKQYYRMSFLEANEAYGGSTEADMVEFISYGGYTTSIRKVGRRRWLTTVVFVEGDGSTDWTKVKAGPRP